MSKHAISFKGTKHMTKQSFKDECDINKIMAKFQKTGAINHYATHAPQYGEITQNGLNEAMQIVAKAEEMFADLPSTVRKRFENEPGQFLDFVQDPKNREEMRELGLVKGRNTDLNKQRESDKPPTETKEPEQTTQSAE